MLCSDWLWRWWISFQTVLPPLNPIMGPKAAKPSLKLLPFTMRGINEIEAGKTKLRITSRIAAAARERSDQQYLVNAM